MKEKPTAANRTRIYQATPANLARLAEILRKGGLVGVPTETVYGLAANALDAAACRGIFRAKGRPSNDPLIVHIESVDRIETLAETNPAVRKVAKAFWPGPLTLVLKKKDTVPSVVTAGRDSVAVRVSSHPTFRKLLALCRLPLAAPSANPFGYISPTTAQHVKDGLGKKIEHILDGGPATIGVESTILDLRDPAHPKILRPGAIEHAALEKVLGVRVARPKARAQADEAAVAPGMLLRHYSPRTPLVLHRQLKREDTLIASANEAFILMKPLDARIDKSTTARPRSGARRAAQGNIFALSKNGDLTACAKSLFATLRQLDKGNWKRIHAELAPGDSALATAINDRLTRAAAKR
ncbi:MAG TPA: L-threonylcarbamoyladenylate synthase [Opitutaceae bacterium]|nr:L-threonylcarbamoyladenylate synthase [Opitutaceae bacterium]